MFLQIAFIIGSTLLIQGDTLCIVPDGNTPCGKMYQTLYNTTNVKREVIVKSVEKCLYSKEGPCSLDPVFDCLNNADLPNVEIPVPASFLAQYDISLISKFSSEIEGALKELNINGSQLVRPLKCLMKVLVRSDRKCQLGLPLVRKRFFENMVDTPWDRLSSTTIEMIEIHAAVLNLLEDQAEAATYAIWPNYASYKHPTRVVLFSSRGFSPGESIYLGQQSCTGVSMLSEHLIECLSSGSYSEIGKPNEVRIGQEPSSLTFTFKKDYYVKEISPKTIFSGGGTKISGVGRYLKSATEVLFTVKLNRTGSKYPPAVGSLCDVKNDTIVYCVSPSLVLCTAEDDEEDKKKNKTSTKEKLQSTTAGKEQIVEAVGFPSLVQWEDRKTHDPCTVSLLQILAQEDYTFPKSLKGQVRVEIGGIPCDYINISLTSMTCKPGKDPVAVGWMDVKVYFGEGKDNVVFVGKLKYAPPNIHCTSVQIALSVVFITVVALAIGIFFAVRLCRTTKMYGYKKRKRKYELFEPIPEEDPSETGEATSSRSSSHSGLGSGTLHQRTPIHTKNRMSTTTEEEILHLPSPSSNSPIHEKIERGIDNLAIQNETNEVIDDVFENQQTAGRKASVFSQKGPPVWYSFDIDEVDENDISVVSKSVTKRSSLVEVNPADSNSLLEFADSSDLSLDAANRFRLGQSNPVRIQSAKKASIPVSSQAGGSSDDEPSSRLNVESNTNKHSGISEGKLLKEIQGTSQGFHQTKHESDSDSPWGSFVDVNVGSVRARPKKSRSYRNALGRSRKVLPQNGSATFTEDRERVRSTNTQAYIRKPSAGDLSEMFSLDAARIQSPKSTWDVFDDEEYSVPVSNRKLQPLNKSLLSDRGSAKPVNIFPNPHSKDVSYQVPHVDVNRISRSSYSLK